MELDTLGEIEFESPTLNEKGEIVTRTQYKAVQFSQDLGDGLCLDMIVIPSSIFQMGSPNPVFGRKNPQNLRWYNPAEFRFRTGSCNVRQ